MWHNTACEKLNLGQTYENVDSAKFEDWIDSLLSDFLLYQKASDALTYRNDFSGDLVYKFNEIVPKRFRTEIKYLLSGEVFLIRLFEYRSDEINYKYLFNIATRPLVILNEKGIVECNVAILNLLGYDDSNELIGKKLNDISPTKQKNNELSEELAIHYHQQTIDKGSTKFEWELKSKSGELIPVEITFKSFDMNGKTWLYGYWRGLSEQKSREDELKNSQKFINRVAAASPSIIYIFSIIDNKFTYFNRDLKLLLGYTNELVNSMTPKKLLKIIHPKDRRAYIAHTKGLFALEDNIVTDITLRILHKNGSWIWLQLRDTVFERDINGNVVKILGNADDVSSRKIAEEELIKTKIEAETANKSKSIFLANMSHEIRTPMNSILGFGEILKEHVTEEPAKDYLQNIISSGKHLLNVINDILDLSKIEAGKMSIQLTPINFHKLCSNVISMFEMQAKNKGLGLRLIIKHFTPTMILADETRLSQILVNLIGNAVKFTNEGVVTLITDARLNETQNACELIIHINDTGIGIPIEQQKIIFEPFRQSDELNTRKFGGTGLGLTITKKFVEMMKGKIYLDSQLNIGSTFTIKLDNVIILNKDKVVSDETKGNDKLSRNVKILSIDDVPANHRIIKGMLRSQTATIETAESAEEALEKLKIFSPDVILMDIQMPKIDGLTLTKMIKNMKEFSHVSIIAITAYALDEDKKKILQVCDGYLTKPISRQILIDTINSFVDQKIDEVENIKIKTLISQNNNSIPDDELRQKMIKTANLLLQTNEVDKIIAFTNEVKLFAEKYACLHYIPIAEDIARAASNFDLDEMVNNIKYFIETVNQYRQS